MHEIDRIRILIDSTHPGLSFGACFIEIRALLAELQQFENREKHENHDFRPFWTFWHQNRVSDIFVHAGWNNARNKSKINIPAMSRLRDAFELKIPHIEIEN